MSLEQSDLVINLVVTLGVLMLACVFVAAVSIDSFISWNYFLAWRHKQKKGGLRNSNTTN